jgi:acetylglutamate kinase
MAVSETEPRDGAMTPIDVRATSVFKVGGAHLADPDYLDRLAALLGREREHGAPAVLVHGGGKEIAALHEKLDVPYRVCRDLRVTSPESMRIVTMVLVGLVNPRVVSRLNAAGVPAQGLHGGDRHFMCASVLDAERLQRVGGPPRVDVAPLHRLIAEGITPVVAPVCVDAEGEFLNVNADTTAQAVAMALGAERLDFITDVPAVRTARGDARTLSPADVAQLMRDAEVKGGMVPKLHAAVAALRGGVGRVRVGNLETLADGRATAVVS